MSVFIALRIHETDIMGVYATLAEAAALRPDAIDEYEVGSAERKATYSYVQAVDEYVEWICP